LRRQFKLFVEVKDEQWLGSFLLHEDIGISVCKAIVLANLLQEVTKWKVIKPKKWNNCTKML